MIRKSLFFCLHLLLADNYTDSHFLNSVKYISNWSFRPSIRPMRETLLIDVSSAFQILWCRWQSTIRAILCLHNQSHLLWIIGPSILLQHLQPPWEISILASTRGHWEKLSQKSKGKNDTSWWIGCVLPPTSHSPQWLPQTFLLLLLYVKEYCVLVNQRARPGVVGAELCFPSQM